MAPHSGNQHRLHIFAMLKNKSRSQDRSGRSNKLSSSISIESEVVILDDSCMLSECEVLVCNKCETGPSSWLIGSTSALAAASMLQLLNVKAAACEAAAWMSLGDVVAGRGSSFASSGKLR